MGCYVLWRGAGNRREQQCIKPATWLNLSTLANCNGFSKKLSNIAKKKGITVIEQMEGGGEGCLPVRGDI